MLYIKLIIKLDKTDNSDYQGHNGTDINCLVCVQVCILITFQKLHKQHKAGCRGSKQDSFLAICIYKATMNYVDDQKGCLCFLLIILFILIINSF